MADDDYVASFSTKLSVMAHELSVLGKKYKEKKFLRYLPLKFVTHKMVLKMTTNTDELKFNKLVGMLKAEEMKIVGTSATTSVNLSRSVTLVVDKKDDIPQEIENTLRTWWEMMDLSSKERDQAGKHHICQRCDGDSGMRRDLQCYESKSFGHMRSNCLVARRRELKCYECRVIGHKRSKCPNSKK